MSTTLAGHIRYGETMAPCVVHIADDGNWFAHTQLAADPPSGYIEFAADDGTTWIGFAEPAGRTPEGFLKLHGSRWDRTYPY